MDDDVDALDLGMDEDLWDGNHSTKHAFGRHSFSASITREQPSCAAMPSTSGQARCMTKAEREVGINTISVEQDAEACNASSSGLQGTGDFLMSLFGGVQEHCQNANRVGNSKNKQQNIPLGKFSDLGNRMPSSGMLVKATPDVPLSSVGAGAALNDNSEGAGLLRSTQVDGKGSIEATTDVENINEVNEQTHMDEPWVNIPGPAGRLCQAKQAKVPFPFATRNNRSALSSPVNELDVDFLSNAWCAGSQAITQGSVGNCTLKAVCSGDVHGRLEQILVIVTDIRPNGGGSVFTQLKDPTGSIGGVLHSSTLTMHPNICPGTVLVLEKVAVFSPCQETHYLCIMPDNVKEVVQEAPSDSSHAHGSAQSVLQNASLSLANRARQTSRANSFAACPSANGHLNQYSSTPSFLRGQRSLDSDNVPKMTMIRNAPYAGHALNSSTSADLSSQATHSEGLRHSRARNSQHTERHSGQTMPPPPPREVNHSEIGYMECSQENPSQYQGSSWGKGRQLSIKSFLQKNLSAQKRKAQDSADVEATVSSQTNSEKPQQTGEDENVQSAQTESRSDVGSRSHRDQELPNSGSSNFNVLDLFQEVRESYQGVSQSQIETDPKSKGLFKPSITVEEVSLGEVFSRQRAKAPKIKIEPK